VERSSLRVGKKCVQETQSEKQANNSSVKKTKNVHAARSVKKRGPASSREEKKKSAGEKGVLTQYGVSPYHKINNKRRENKRYRTELKRASRAATNKGRTLDAREKQSAKRGSVSDRNNEAGTIP